MNIVDKISRTFIFLIFFIPIYINSFSNSPYELSKTFFSFIIISILSLVIITLKKDLVYPNKFIIIFFIASFISTIFSNNQSESFFGYYPRYSEGDLINLGVFLFCFCLVNLIPKLDIPKIIFFSSIPICIFLSYESFSNNDRLIGTFGQPNFLAIFIVISIIFLFKNFKKFPTVFSYFYLLILFFFLSKAASLSSIFSLVILSPLIFWDRSLKFNYKKFTIGFLIILLVAIFFLKDSIILKKFIDIQNQFKEDSPTIISDSLLIRKNLWESTFILSTIDTKNFLIGHGSNSFIYFFERNRNQNLNNLSEKFLFFDKPHNYYLEILFNLGILGLSLFIYLIFLALKKKDNNSIYILTLCIFIFTNWLDIYTKIIFFLLITQSLPKEKIKFDLKYLLIIFSAFTFIVSIIFLLSDFYRYKNKFKEAYNLNPLNNEYATLYFLENESKHNNFKLFKNPIINTLWLKNINKKNKNDLIIYLKSEYPNNFVINSYIEKYK